MFYVTLPFKMLESNESQLKDLVAESARANSYWSFELIDSKQSATIKVLCDPQNKTVKTTLVNGTDNFFDRSFETYLNGIRKLGELDVKAKADIDGDKQLEYVVYTKSAEDTSDAVNLHVVRWNGSKFENLGKLEDAVFVVHGLDHVEIARMDQTNTNYIAVYMLGGLGGYGFNLYQWVKGHPVLIESNFPNATGEGNRYLKDMDQDGVKDSVYEYSYDDLQSHTLYFYKRFDGKGPEKYKVVYNNKPGKFTYPQTAEQVIQNYIEDSYWPEAYSSEMKLLVASSGVLKFKVSNEVDLEMLEYGPLELEFKILSDKNGSRKIEVTQKGGTDSKSLQFTMITSNGQWKIKSIQEAN
ncbi:hypothetical protein [Paenibacillus sp. HW567]|uniref:hypothetical protein n=1 Tax=Paenibacillus sp. HW567 TaxID=1034769 RepID=UPI0003698B5C|nr:hypothetical protein [Paenibacillus sp. HW567]